MTLFRDLCSKLFVKALTSSMPDPEPEDKGLSTSDWVKMAPDDCEVVVFTQESTFFLRSPHAPTMSCALVSSLFDEKNEDLLAKLHERFAKHLH